jgi:hypothetical protein
MKFCRIFVMKGPLLLTIIVVPLLGCFSSCSNQVMAKHPVSYRFIHGRTAMLKNGIAIAPKSAPVAVKKAIAAGNRLQSKPYKWGGGHGCHIDSGYDCSGTVSYVLREAGLLKGSITSSQYFNYGKKGAGDWITVYVRRGHVFMTVAGLRLDTGWGADRSGPRWLTQTRPGKGHAMRHPAGL